MRKSCIANLLLFLFISTSLLHSQSALSVNEIIEKNIQAVGGKENLEQIKNYSFKFGTTTYYMSRDGWMKITEGSDPIITEAVVVDKDNVRRNCFNKISEIRGLQKSVYQCLAQLRCGLFTLDNFRDRLEFNGLKSFGPEKLYMLITKMAELDIEFYVDSQRFTLKRVVFKSFDPDQGKVEVNHDIGSYQEINGVKIPSSWYGSQVGIRGKTYEISGLKINQALDKAFFSCLEINAGEVKIDKGELNGNIIESNFSRNMLQIMTNWTEDCTKRAGFKSGDKLILRMGDTDIEIDFTETFPERSSLGPGSKLLTPNPRGENFLILLISPEYEPLYEKLEALLPIRVRKK